MRFWLILGMFPGFLTMICLYFLLKQFGLTQEGAVPGLIMMAFAAAFPASIGIGDGMVIAAGGIGTGFSAAFESLVLALLVCAVYSGILLIRRKASRKDCLPFIPFLAAGHVLVLAAEMIAA